MVRAVRHTPLMPLETLTEVLYSTSATATGGRVGRVQSADGVLDLELRRPGSKSNPAANPETLFAAGYAACFGSALTSAAKERDVDVSNSSVTAAVSLGKTDTGVGLAVTLTAHLPGVDPDIAQQLLDAAHHGCPYSKATRGNIEVTVELG